MGITRNPSGKTDDELGNQREDGLRVRLADVGRHVGQHLGWRFWVLALVSCPALITYLGLAYERHGGPFPQRPWPALAVEYLFYLHILISIVGAIFVPWWTRGDYR